MSTPITSSLYPQVSGQTSPEKRETSSISDVDLSTPEGLATFLSNNDPYKGQQYLSSSLWSNKRVAEQANSALDMQIRSNDYQTSIAQYLFELQYNSEQSKVQRMREAGLNPDLQGLDGASEAPSRDIESQEPGEHPQSDPGQELSQVAGIVTSAFSTAISVAGGIESIKGQRLDNDGKEVSLLNSIVEQSISFLSEDPMFSEWLKSDRSNRNSPLYEPFILSSRFSSTGKGLDFPFPTRLNKRYTRTMGAVSDWMSSRSQSFAKNNDVIDALAKYAGFGNDNDSIIHTIGILNDGLNAATEAVNRATKAHNDFDAEYFDALDTGKAASATNAGYAASKAQSEQAVTQSEIQKNLDTPMNKITERLYDDFNKDPKKNWFSGVLLFFMRIGEAFRLNIGNNKTPVSGSFGF